MLRPFAFSLKINVFVAVLPASPDSIRVKREVRLQDLRAPCYLWDAIHIAWGDLVVSICLVALSGCKKRRPAAGGLGWILPCRADGKGLAVRPATDSSAVSGEGSPAQQVCRLVPDTGRCRAAPAPFGAGLPCARESLMSREFAAERCWNGRAHNNDERNLGACA